MKPEFDGIREKILSLEERMLKLGVRHAPTFQFQYDMCLSPFQDKAHQFAESLDKQLTTLEWSRRIYGHEVVPELDPDTSILLGTTVQGNTPVRIDLNKHIVTHIVVSGASGSGKTTAISTIVNQLAGKIGIILIDHKDEGLRFANKTRNSAYFPLVQQRWNPLSGQGDQRAYLLFLASQLTRLLALMPVTSNAVKAKLIALCSDPDILPSVSDLCAIFSKLAQKEQRSNLHTAARGFEDLAAIMGRWGDVRQGRFSFNDYGLSVIPLKDCPPSFEFFYIALLFKQLTDMATAKGHTNQLRQVVVFDEGRGFFGKELEPGTASGRMNLQADILTKSRSYGNGIIIGTQSVTALQSTVLDNTGTYIILRANSEREAKASCRLLGLDESRYMDFINFKPGRAYVVTPDNRTPLLVNITNTDLGVYPSEADIARKIKPEWEKWDAQAVFAPGKSSGDEKIDFRVLLGEMNPPDTTPSSAENEPSETCSSNPASIVVPTILDEYFELLQCCSDHPDLGVATLYKTLGWSGGRGNRVKTKLIELEWVEPIRLASPKGGRPKKTLKITDTGKGVLNERT